MSNVKEYLSVRNLKVHYTSDDEIIHAVNGVSFDLEKGTTLGLVGETGAGKTTIAKSILQILPDRSASIEDGEIYFDGKDLLKLSEEELLAIRGHRISMIFQDPMTALNPVLSIGDQIAEVIKVHQNVTKREARQRAVNMLEMVGIPGGRYDEYPYQFSGGMKQRVVIAMALACDPELLLADEPTTALDVTIQAQVLEMINDLKKKLNTSMILITHDLGVVAQCCDKVAVIYAGKIIEYGDKVDIFDHPAHPYTKGLFASLPTLTGDERRLKPIDGMTPDPTDLPEGCAFHPRCRLAAQCCRTGKEIEMKELTPGHLCRCCNIAK